MVLCENAGVCSDKLKLSHLTYVYTTELNWFSHTDIHAIVADCVKVHTCVSGS